MKVVLVHDWLIHMRGGEKVLDAIAEIFPEAEIHTLFYRREKLSTRLQGMKIRASFLQWIPGIRIFYRWLLPVLPWLIQTMSVREADLVISSSHCVAKGIRVPPNAYHICYCHTPMRYIWGFEKVYFEKCPAIFRPVLTWLLKRLRQSDLQSNTEVDLFVANSKNVQERILRHYQRESTVIYPPLDSSLFYPDGAPSDYYLVVSAFVPYKRVDLVIEAFNELDRKLLIVGSGPLGRLLYRLRKSDRIFFLKEVPNGELRNLYGKARALIFPTEEDFGIVPLEAQACGTPVIAYARGGALESVQYGTFFHEQTAEAIQKAVLRFEQESFDRSLIPAAVASFDRSSFQNQFGRLVDSALHPLSS